MSCYGLVAGWIVVSLVQAQMLSPSLWPLHHYAFRGNGQQLGIVNIGSGHHQAQRPSAAVNQQAALAASLAPIRGVAAH